MLHLMKSERYENCNYVLWYCDECGKQFWQFPEQTHFTHVCDDTELITVHEFVYGK